MKRNLLRVFWLPLLFTKFTLLFPVSTVNLKYQSYLILNNSEVPVPHSGFRSSCPTAGMCGLTYCRFAPSTNQVGMAVEMHQDDVWWEGLVLRKTPACVQVYMPGVYW